MSAARDAMLAAVRAALAGAPAPPAARAVAPAPARPATEVVRLFAERVAGYGGYVEATDRPRAAVEDVLRRHGARRVGVPPGLDPQLRPHGVELVDDVGLSPAELDALDGALTCCGAACAETGTIALAGGPDEGRRALTLVPDLHVCVVRADRIVGSVAELLALLGPLARERRPIVLVSGPSATSDIELRRVEGVHGPRRLAVVVATAPAAA